MRMLVDVALTQDPDKRPLITEVKDALLEFARLHFNSQSPAEAMALKHVKERALLDQILPPKVSTGSICGNALLSSGHAHLVVGKLIGNSVVEVESELWAACGSTGRCGAY